MKRWNPTLVRSEVQPDGYVRLTWAVEGATIETTLLVSIRGVRMGAGVAPWAGRDAVHLDLMVENFGCEFKRPPAPVCWCGPDPREAA